MSFTLETACDVRFTGVLGAVSTFGLGVVVGVVMEAIFYNLLEAMSDPITWKSDLYYTHRSLIPLDLLHYLDDFGESLVARILPPSTPSSISFMGKKTWVLLEQAGL